MRRLLRSAAATTERPLGPSRFERHSVVLLAAWTLSLSPGLALAQQPRKLNLVEAISAAFERADTDGDGYLSPQEAQRLPAVSQRFERLDTDGDGKLSREEFMQGLKKDS